VLTFQDATAHLYTPMLHSSQTDRDNSRNIFRRNRPDMQPRDSILPVGVE
jgi:hypothetical protein